MDKLRFSNSEKATLPLDRDRGQGLGRGPLITHLRGAAAAAAGVLQSLWRRLSPRFLRVNIPGGFSRQIGGLEANASRIARSK